MNSNRDNKKYNRFKEAPWFPSEKIPVLIGGAGGIGSWLTLLLARAGFEPHVFDFDTLEEHNLGGQLYPVKSIGKSKIEALAIMVEDFSGTKISGYNEKLTKDTMTNDIVFSAFDNMEARKVMFHKWVEDNKGNKNAIFIDGRLTAEQSTILCVRGDDTVAIEQYEVEHLFDDSEVEDAPCTFKQTSHTAAIIAGHMVGFFTNFYSSVTGADDSRTVPFYWEYYTPIDMFDIQYKAEAKVKEVPSEVVSQPKEEVQLENIDLSMKEEIYRPLEYLEELKEEALSDLGISEDVLTPIKPDQDDRLPF